MPVFILLAVLVCSAPVAHSQAPQPTLTDEAALPIEKWTVQRRAESPDRYENLPCDALAQAQAATPAEQRQLVQRKRQCLRQYRAFIPADGMH